jgi:hypothetical protein
MGNAIGAIRKEMVGPRAAVPGPRKLEMLLEHLLRLQRSSFTGELRINFTQGSIGRVEQVEEMSFGS